MRRRDAAIGVALWLVVTGAPVTSSAADLVISQVYGGGGNSGASLKSDFVELFNRGATPADLGGWSVQYASASAATWQLTALNGVVEPGSYYLVQLAGGGGGLVDLPAADAFGTTNMAAASGKVALVGAGGALQSACPNDPSVVDFVGYGGANCFEGTGAAPAGSNTLALLRGEGGCTETDDNASDLTTAAPQPRNGSNVTICAGVDPLTETLTPSSTETATASATSSVTATRSPMPSPSSTPSPAPTSTISPTATATTTPTASVSASASASPSPPLPSITPSSTVPVGTCGDGFLDSGEQCDDGNLVDGDLCPDGCSYRQSGALIHGNHRRRLARGDGCQLQWYVVGNELERDRFGFARETQTCVDQDGECDFAPESGRCRFLVVVCLNNGDDDLPACEAAGVDRAAVVHPRQTDFRGGSRATNRAALENALMHLVDPARPLLGAVFGPPLTADQRDLCSQPFPLDVERRGSGRGASSVIVDTFGGQGRESRRERSRLRLICSS